MNVKRTSPIRVFLTPDEAALVVRATANLLAATGKAVSPSDLMREGALRFVAAMQRCGRCVASVACQEHMIHPPPEAPKEDLAGYADLVDAYFVEWQKRTGEKPYFTERDGAAVKALLRRHKIEKAKEMIARAAANGRTIQSLVRDPTAATTRGPKNKAIQARSGYNGQEGKSV